MLKQIIATLIPLLLTTACAGQSPNVVAGSTPETRTQRLQIRPVPAGVSIHRLDNGLEVLLIENPGLPMVGVNIVVKVGSAFETFASSGMSHMLEHLLFNGTTNRSQEQLYSDVDRIGGYNNANTSEFYTNYMMVTPAEHIKTGMKIQADMLFNSTLPTGKFEKEKGIVLEEIARSLANANTQLERNIASILYRGHALSLPTVGTYATIESMSRDAVHDFYKNNYVPNNMILSAIGNFQADSMLALIKETYGTAAPGEVKRPHDSAWMMGFSQLESPAYLTQSVFHRFYDGEKNKLQLFYPLPAAATEEFLTLLEIAIDTHLDSLQTAIQAELPGQVESMQFATRASVLANHLQVTVNLAHTENLQALANAVHRRMRKLTLSLPAAQVQLQAVKAQTNFLKNIEKPHMFGIYNADAFAVRGIEAVLASYSGDRYFAAAQQVRNLQLRDQPVVIVQHASAGEKSKESVASMQKAMFKGQAGAPTLIAVQNPASSLLAIHYLLKNKAHYESQFGANAAKILHECLRQRLTSKENQQASNRYGFAYKFNDNAYIPMDNIYLHPDFGYLRVEGLAVDLPGALDFLSQNMVGFVPTVAEFKKVQKKFQRAGHMRGGQKAKKLFEQTYKEAVYEPDKYPPNDSLTYESLLSFAKQYFHPANMIVSVVSPAAPDSVGKLFSGFRAQTGHVLATNGAAWDRGLQTPAEPIAIDKAGGGEQAHLFWGFVREVEAVDKPALKALSLILSDRIIFDIREKQGLAYRMNAGIELKKNKALFYVRMATRPQNTDTIVPQFPGFFDASALASLTPEEVEKSINMYLGRMMFRRLSSINQAYYLGHSYYFHGDMTYDSRFLSRLREVDVAAVKRVAQKYMQIINPVSVVIR